MRLADGFSEPSTLLYSDNVERGVEADLPEGGEPRADRRRAHERVSGGIMEHMEDFE